MAGWFILSAGEMMYTFRAASLGASTASAVMARIWPTVMSCFGPFSPCSRVTRATSGWMPERAFRQSRHTPQGGSAWPHKSDAARRRAAPSRAGPSGPSSIYAWESRLSAIIVRFRPGVLSIMLTPPGCNIGIIAYFRVSLQ